MEAKPVPKWVWMRYARLWKACRDRPFTFKEAKKILKFDDNSAISVMFLELRRAGWISIELNQEDARMRIYTLALPNQIVEAVKHDTQKH